MPRRESCLEYTVGCVRWGVYGGACTVGCVYGGVCVRWGVCTVGCATVGGVRWGGGGGGYSEQECQVSHTDAAQIRNQNKTT
jgi:hypothetical protein